jgi:hypothetical protein
MKQNKKNQNAKTTHEKTPKQKQQQNKRQGKGSLLHDPGGLWRKCTAI